jgi:hypothetical protein
MPAPQKLATNRKARNPARCCDANGYAGERKTMKIRVKGLVVVAALLLLASAVVLSLPRLRLLVALKSEYSRANAPWAYRLPEKRTVQTAASESQRRRLSCDWFSFQPPWEAKQELRSEHAQAFVFGSKRIFIVSLRPEQEGILKALLGGDPTEAREMQLLIGEDNLRSEFAALDFCLRVSPDQAGVLSSTRDLTRITSMLILKSVFTPLGDEIYTFRIGDLQGFQFGNPDTASVIYIYLFDTDDRLFRMKINDVTQSEIDVLLASIQMT